MPIYEYACAGCDSEFEAEQRITEDPLKSCPKCRSKRVKRLISRTSFALKGGGWYADGYGSSSKSGNSGSGSDESSGAKSGSDGDSSSDSGSSNKSKGKSKDKKAVA